MRAIKSVAPWAWAAVLLGLAMAAATVVALNLRDEGTTTAAPAGTSRESQPLAQRAAAIEQGRYLALAGNCAACHTLPGGQAYAGGLGIPTPFGVVFAGNLTPDVGTGLGAWTADDFWRAMHNGRSRDGHLLYPAFPYTNFTRISRADSDALFSFLQALPPAQQANRPHELSFPFNTQPALAVWRALYFSPGVHQDDPAKSAEWNRGAYLVRGLGHCDACHAPRDLLGGAGRASELAGGLIPQLNWFAPALGPAAHAAARSEQVTQRSLLLKTGRSAEASASGPMAEVVFKSTQYLADADLRAMALFLSELPALPRQRVRAALPPTPALGQAGPTLYKDHCATCHGDNGEGVAGAYPRLAGNPVVLAEPPANLVRMVIEGGFMPATAGNPRPYGMPPFGANLSDSEIATVLSHLRNAWGNEAPALLELDVRRYR